MKKIFILFAILFLTSWQTPSFAQKRGGVDALECVSVERNERGVASVQNNCSTVITVMWCVADECRGSGFYTDTANLRAGKSYPVSGGKGKQVRYAACWGSNQSMNTRADGAFSCE